MSQSPDQPPSPKLTSQERQVRVDERLKSIRLRMAIGRELDDKGAIDPVEIGAALGMPTVEAARLLTRNQWREGDVALLEAAAARLGVKVPGA
jgi:hypothetical protein